jgi:mannose-6-phosphate isomerase-like protein (cupin superfamily)
MVTAAMVAVACESPTGVQSEQVGVRSAEVTKGQTKGKEMKTKKGFVQNIDKLTTDNHDFRRVVYTGQHMQLVLMSLPPGEHIGMEAHDVDQFFRVEEGSGEVVIDDARHRFETDFAIIVPAGAKHDVINTGSTPLKVYTLYAPPKHRDRVVHRTRAEAEKDTEEFDGKTTE